MDAPDTTLQELYQDICRLVALAYSSAEASLISHVGNEAFITALSGGNLQLEVMKQELSHVEAALSHAIQVYCQSQPDRLRSSGLQVR